MPSERRMYFCDGSGFPLDDTPPGIQAPGFSFTAYLKSDYFSKLLAENRLEIANLDTPTSNVLVAAKETMRDHFRRRASEKAAGLVEEWQRENVYPYQGQPATAIEEAERQVFNVLALNVNHFLPSFQESDEKNKRLQLRLLRHAVQHAPADLSKILTEVLDLPVEKRQELAELLDRTTLAHIIRRVQDHRRSPGILAGPRNTGFRCRIQERRSGAHPASPHRRRKRLDIRRTISLIGG